MRPLSAHDILDIWEAGRNLHPRDRALVLVSAAAPDTDRDTLAQLTIGQRDAILLDLREHIFGPTLKCFAACSRCSGDLEFSLAAPDLRKPGKQELTQELTTSDVIVRFRLPDSTDIAAASREDAQTARTLLTQRCVVAATRNGVPIAASELSDETIVLLADRMSECEPCADVLVDLRCPECDHQWQLIFDIAAFLWTEISSLAKRLLNEVHILAKAYGWREADILSMKPARRQLYLDMVT